MPAQHSGRQQTMGDTDIRFYISVVLKRLPYVIAIVGALTGTGAGRRLSDAAGLSGQRPDPGRTSADPGDNGASDGRDQSGRTAADHRTAGHDPEKPAGPRQTAQIYRTRAAGLSDADIVENLRARTTLEQVQMDRPTGGQSATVFSISFTAKEPQLAADVVNDLVSLILGRNVGLRTSKAEDTMEFFEKEVARLGAELARLEQGVLEFRNANQVRCPTASSSAGRSRATSRNGFSCSSARSPR